MSNTGIVTGSNDDTKTTGSGSKKHNATDVDQHHGKKKTTPTQQSRSYNKEGRGNKLTGTNGGGRNSNYTYKKQDRSHKKESMEHHNKHGSKINSKDSWTSHGKGAKHTSGDVPYKGHKTISSNKIHLEDSSIVDSGISEGSSPEGPKTIDMTDTMSDNGVDNDNKETVNLSDRYIYDRDFLLSIRNCTESLITPAGFDQLPLEVSKDLLKGNHRHSGADNYDDGNSSDTGGGTEPSTTHHPNTLSFNKDNNQKSKVSLMPQRRSFGSGCSWREHPISKGTAPIGIVDDHPNESSSNHESSPGWSSGGTPRVIDHVPYRSRPNNNTNNWKTNKGTNSWREKNNANTDEYYEEDDEPEWMSFGPSDRYELMELKGIDEHELEREARKESKPSSYINDDKSLSLYSDESSSSSPLDKNAPKSGSVHSSRPPLPEDEDEFVLDGFDFKSVLSMCQELASDTDNNHQEIQEEPLSTVKDSAELENALLSVLGIANNDDDSDNDDDYTMEANNTINKTRVRPMTLDEIEGQTNISTTTTTTTAATTTTKTDQSAFNKFLASINQPKPQHTVAVTSSNTNESTLIKVPPQASNHSSFFTDKSDHLPYNSSVYNTNTTNTNTNSLYSPSSHYNTPRHNEPINHAHQKGWPPNTSWPNEESHGRSSSHLFHPSPSSLGMSPHHNRQQQHKPSSINLTGNSSWVTEMELLRQSELNQMRYYEQREDDRQQRIMQQKQQQNSGVSVGQPPSLSFLPTSVMRHIHNSKPTQSIKDVTRTLSHSRMDHDYPPDPSSHYSSMATPDSSTSYHHHRHTMHQSQSPQYHHYPSHYPYMSSYRPNLRGMPPSMDQTGLYHQQHYMRTGSSPVKPNLY